MPDPAVIVNAHPVGRDRAYISWFYVPPEARSRGVGRRAYEAWERKLPRSVKTIRLHAADSGDGPSDGFWQRLGFDYRWSADEIDDAVEAGADRYQLEHEMEKARTLYPAPRRKRSGLAGLRAATSANGSTFIAAADLAALEAFVTDGASKAEARRLAEVFDFTVPPGSHWYEGNAYKWRLATIDDPEAVEEDDDGKLTITATRDVVWRLHKGDDWVSVADPQGILDDHSLDPADYITVVDELEDFWEHPTRLYHATTEDAAEDIVVEGLLPMSGSRGLRNRGVGKAVFTTLNEEQAHHGPYGDVVFEIDTKAMARDGYTPEVSQEPDVVEAEALNALASALNVEDFVSESENDRETVIVYGAIPAKYLRRAD